MEGPWGSHGAPAAQGVPMAADHARSLGKSGEHGPMDSSWGDVAQLASDSCPMDLCRDGVPSQPYSHTVSWVLVSWVLDEVSIACDELDSLVGLLSTLPRFVMLRLFLMDSSLCCSVSVIGVASLWCRELMVVRRLYSRTHGEEGGLGAAGVTLITCCWWCVSVAHHREAPYIGCVLAQAVLISAVGGVDGKHVARLGPARVPPSACFVHNIHQGPGWGSRLPSF